MGYVESLMGQSEKIIYLTRQHWITLLRNILIDGAFILIILIGGILLSGVQQVGNYAFLAYLLMLIPAIDFFLRYLNWHNEQYIITNRRVVQVEGVINKHVIDSSLEKVNDVVLSQSVLGRLLNYGNIEILTGSEIGVNLLERIHAPVYFKTAMLNAKERMGQLDAFDSRARVVTSEAPTSGDVPELIGELDELRQKGVITQEEFESKKRELLSRI